MEAVGIFLGIVVSVIGIFKASMGALRWLRSHSGPKAALTGKPTSVAPAANHKHGDGTLTHEGVEEC